MEKNFVNFDLNAFSFTSRSKIILVLSYITTLKMVCVCTKSVHCKHKFWSGVITEYSNEML